MSTGSEADTAPSSEEFPVCGIVRPIAAMGEDYPTSHWVAVHAIVAEALDSIYRLRIVSETEAAGVILGDIVRNLFEDEVVVFDVSARNPNVMFELGLRMAFQKPAVIIIDDETPYSFDISPIKHLRYPKSLRYADMVAFKQELRQAVVASVRASKQPEYRGYLQQFGPIKVTHLDGQQIDVSMIAGAVADIQRTLHTYIQRPDTRLSSERFKVQDAASLKHRITITVPVEEERAVLELGKKAIGARIIGARQGDGVVKLEYQLDGLLGRQMTEAGFIAELAKAFPHALISKSYD